VSFGKGWWKYIAGGKHRESSKPEARISKQVRNPKVLKLKNTQPGVLDFPDSGLFRLPANGVQEGQAGISSLEFRVSSRIVVSLSAVHRSCNPLAIAPLFSYLLLMRRVYLDHAATSPLDPQVFEAMQPFFSGTYGNASSVHWFGRQARQALEDARERVAQSIGAQPGEMFFTSGGTESNNMAIKGVAIASKDRNKKNHVITSQAEHHAVLEPCEHLAGEGVDATVLPVDSYGVVDEGQVRDTLRPGTGLISIMVANNEVGSISPIREIAAVARERGVVMHSDAVQALGKIPVNVDALGVDLMTLSAHKINGPKGIGALYVRRGTPLDPIIFGGGQERGKRPGTENVPLAVGFARAVDLTMAQVEQESQRLRILRDELERRILELFPAAIRNGHPDNRLPHILNVSFDSTRQPFEGETLLMNMDLNGIALSSGSACTSGSVQPSHVLLAMGRDEKTAKATLRFSFGRGNTMEDVEYTIHALQEVVERMISR